MEPFNELLKRKRREKDLTQTDLASKLNVNQSTISHYETGREKPTAEKLRMLIDLLDISEEIDTLHVNEVCDKVELAIHQSSLSFRDQDLILTVYGHFTDRESVANVNILRMLGN